MRKKSNVCARDSLFQLHIQACICALRALCYLDVYSCASIVGMACAVFTLRRLRCCDRNKFCMGFFFTYKLALEYFQTRLSFSFSVQVVATVHT